MTAATPDDFDSPDGQTYSGPPLPPLPPKWTGKFRKRPVVVEAVQLVDDDACDWDEIARWCGGRIYNIETSPGAEPQTLIDIRTLEGTMTAAEGWWVVRGVVGEFHPVRADIFEATHEPAGAALAAEVRTGHVRIETGGVTLGQAAGIPDMYARHVRAAWPAELTDFAAAEIAGRWEHMTSPRERKFWAEVDAALVAGDRIVRDVLESLCRRDGLPLESSVTPGEPARNYDLADRLGIGHVFGLKPQPAPGIPLRSDAETAAMLRADLADAEAQLARWPRCPSGCSCRIGIEGYADANECGCDGPCNGGAQPAPVPSERDLAGALDGFYGWFTVVGGGARVQGQLQGADAAEFARALHAQLSANRAHRDQP